MLVPDQLTDVHESAPERARGIEIVDNAIVAGHFVEPIPVAGTEPVLRSYLHLVHRIRNEQATSTVVVRRADVEYLAGHLTLSESDIIARIAELMGHSRMRAAALLTRYEAGEVELAIGTDG